MWIAHHAIISAIAALVITVGLWYLWKQLRAQFELRGTVLPPLGLTISRAREIAFKHDTTVVITRGPLAARTPWLTWRALWIFTTTTVIAGPVMFLFGAPAVLTRTVALTSLFFMIACISHIRKIFAFRNRALMQMYQVAATVMKYPRGAEREPWNWVQITEWQDLYTPGLTYVMFQPGFSSEDERTRESFERNFAGSVSDQTTWSFEWKSTDNRVTCTPIPFLPTFAPYKFPDLHRWDEFPLGIGEGGREVIWKVGINPHMLIAGETGSGKSVTQRAILLHALSQPNMRVLLVDPKRVELIAYVKHPSVLRTTIDLAESVELIEQLFAEMASRYQRMKDEGVNHFEKMANVPPAILLMVDEVYTLLATSGLKSEEGKEEDALHMRATALLGRIAREGRAAGIHLVLATQRPDAKVIPGEMKSNLGARVAQGRLDTIASNMVMDNDVATRVPGTIKGRAVMRSGGNNEFFQAYFQPEESLDQLLTMAAAIATGRLTPEAFLPEEPEPEPKQNPLNNLRLPKLPTIPVPSGMKARISAWVASREALVAENDARKSGQPVPEREPKTKRTRFTNTQPGSAAPISGDPRRQEFEAFADADLPEFDDDPFAGWDDPEPRAQPLLAGLQPSQRPEPAPLADLHPEPPVPALPPVPAAPPTRPSVPTFTSHVPVPVQVVPDDPVSVIWDEPTGPVPVPMVSGRPITVEEVLRRAAARGVPIPASELLAALRAEAIRESQNIPVVPAKAAAVLAAPAAPLAPVPVAVPVAPSAPAPRPVPAAPASVPAVTTSGQAVPVVPAAPRQAPVAAPARTAPPASRQVPDPALPVVAGADDDADLISLWQSIAGPRDDDDDDDFADEVTTDAGAQMLEDGMPRSGQIPGWRQWVVPPPPPPPSRR